eukprot:Phypoly_transcript_00748.p1 GENE.Phypoly_transcript_00748~~Phypoly_transcript_00748.p1  ORF type:complete len:1347 (+),score=177.55 Phypoly_transcript_00748:570-4043(+)
MEMYSLLENNPNLTAQEIEDGFDGNLCRCTGYRPILETMKSFAPTGNVKKCPSHVGDIEELCATNHKKYTHISKTKTKPRQASFARPLRSFSTTSLWLTATTLPELYALLVQYTQGVKLVVGNTSSGVFKNTSYSVLIDIHNIPELKAASIGANGASFGAAVTITDMIQLLTQWNNNTQQTSSFPTLVTHMKRIANHQVRNVGCWAGNLMMVHDYDDFSSDMCTILMAVGATLTIYIRGVVTANVSIAAFLTMNMSGNVILNVQIPFMQPNEVLFTYKVAIRHQNSHALVNAGLRAVVNPATSTITSQPTFVFGGIFTKAARMPKTETYLINQPLLNQTVLQNALAILKQEAVPSPGPGRVAYRNSLATVFLYKLYVSILPESSVSPLVRSLRTTFIRPISDGVQSFSTDPSEYPVSQPIPKLKGRLQTSGELVYTGDMPEIPNMLHGAFVMSTNANASLSSIDFTSAMTAQGVAGYVTSKDIPGSNSCSPVVPNDEEILVSNKILYNGQALGLVLADTQRHADEATKLVTAYYSSPQAPILSLQQAIAQKSIFPNYPDEPNPDPIVVGDVTTAFANSPHVISGSVATGGQAHFHMEMHTVVVIPQEDQELLIYVGTQNASALQMVVAQTLNIPASKITVIAKQMGGAYGAKIVKPNQIAAVAAVAAVKFNRPVKIVVDLNSNMQMIGKRQPLVCNYKVGFTNTGTLTALQYDIFVDSGCTIDVGPQLLYTIFTTIDNNYYCPNWLITGSICKTNLPSNTWCRGPGWINAIFFMEYVMEEIAAYLKLDANIIKAGNFYKEGQVTPYGMKLEYFNIPQMWTTFNTSIEYQARLQAVQMYNNNKKWSKKGISMTTVKFGIQWSGNQFGIIINVYPDGTVNITHGGVEIGQGIDTKVAQVVAFELGIPFSSVVVKTPNTDLVPNNSATGGSITTGLCSMAAIQACTALNKILAPVRQSLPPNASWQQVVSTAIGQGIDLQSKGWVNPAPPAGGPYQYNSYAVACSEILLDVLTGEYQNLRTDILFDCGISLNPAVDIGQVEGAFVQGIGLFMQEEVLLDPSGNLITDGTWEYKIPCSQDIPIDFRVSLLPNAPNPVGVLSSKSVGEPPLAAAACVFAAVRKAIQSARGQFGFTGVVALSSPATVENVQTTCDVSLSQFTF